MVQLQVIRGENLFASEASNFFFFWGGGMASFRGETRPPQEILRVPDGNPGILAEARSGGREAFDVLF